MKKQRVDQSSSVHSFRRVHSHSARLVDNDNVGVFVENIERQIFRQIFRVDAFRFGDADNFAAAEFVARLDSFPVDGNRAFANDFLNVRAGFFGKFFTEINVQPQIFFISLKIHRRTSSTRRGSSMKIIT